MSLKQDKKISAHDKLRWFCPKKLKTKAPLPEKKNTKQKINKQIV